MLTSSASSDLEHQHLQRQERWTTWPNPIRCYCLVLQEQILFRKARMELLEVVQFHDRMHGGLACTSEMRLSVASLQEASTNTVSPIVMSVQFLWCRNLYPLCIQRPAPGRNKEQARGALEELAVHLK